MSVVLWVDSVCTVDLVPVLLSSVKLTGVVLLIQFDNYCTADISLHDFNTDFSQCWFYCWFDLIFKK